jgi:predicted metalloprotease with PDZ domain
VLRIYFLSVCLCAFSAAASAQNPFRHPADAAEIRFDSSQPVLFYRVQIDSGDLSSLGVEMHVRNIPDTFRVAMVTHPEYDDRYWRYLEGLRVDGSRGPGSVTRLDSALWLVSAPGGEAVLRYRIRLPAPEQPRRAAWRPFLSPRGGLAGGPHTFLYVVGATLAPSHVNLDIPAGWEALTGLEPTADPRTFFAPSAAILVDSPFLVGHIKTWRFAVDGVPHRIAYLPLPGSEPFDTTALVTCVARLAGEAEKLFGRFPYREYTFLLQDGAYGALEHLNSVTVGFSSGEFAKDPRPLFATLSHEYFHAWNLMRLRPAEFGDVSYTPAPRSRGLWWSEGVTMMYADILLRRAGLPVYDSTRVAHLEEAIGAYAGSPGDSLFSPEYVSLFAFAGTPGGLGDYSASTHIQGELLGTMIDLIIRDATDGVRSMDDLVRAMFRRFSGERGFTGGDIENSAAELCGCDMHSFFDTYVRAGHGIDFNRYLGMIGLRMRLSWVTARDPGGSPAPDLRVFAWLPPGESSPALGISDPESCWGRAGLHTGDIITGVNGKPAPSAADFRTLVRGLHTGDTLAIEVRHQGEFKRAFVTVTGYDRPGVKIEEIMGVPERQRALRDLWKASAP